MTEIVICDHCSLQHGIHETNCRVTGLPLTQDRRVPRPPGRGTVGVPPTDGVAGETSSSARSDRRDPFADRFASQTDFTNDEVAQVAVAIQNKVFVVVETEPLLVGRTMHGHNIELPDNVSASHAILRLSQGRLTITDVGSAGIGSTNGTFVNGHRIRPSTPIAITVEDLVELGQSPATRIELVK